jgi:hypothetical protein
MTFRRTLCPHCKGKLEQGQRIHISCIGPWADAQAEKAKRTAQKQARMAAKVERASIKARKEAIKSRADWAREAQTAFNAFIRARDDGLPCISCGRHHQGQWHAGHYLSTGARPELRYTESNVHRQCAPCNTHLSGNAVLYRIGLIERIGLEAVEWLEGPHELPKWTPDDYKAIRDNYRQKLKDTLKGINADARH